VVRKKLRLKQAFENFLLRQNKYRGSVAFCVVLKIFSGLCSKIAIKFLPENSLHFCDENCTVFNQNMATWQKNAATKKTSMKRGIVKWNWLYAHHFFCFSIPGREKFLVLVKKISKVNNNLSNVCNWMHQLGFWGYDCFFFENFEFWANNTFMAQHDLKFFVLHYCW